MRTSDIAHPDHHSESSARKFGGRPSDYHEIHDWFDQSKSHIATPAHRALRHHSQGIWEAQQRFGRSIVNSDGRSVPVRFIGEQHVREDCRRIPSLADWLRHLVLEPWMVNGVILPPLTHASMRCRAVDAEPVSADPQADWRAAVAEGQTVLGYRDWLAMQAQRIGQDLDREDGASGGT